MITRIEQIFDHVKSSRSKMHVVVAAANDKNALESMHDAYTNNIVEGTLVGPKDQINALAKEVSVNIDNFEIIDIKDPIACTQQALELIRDNKAEVLMKGLVQTGDLIHLVLDRKYGLRTDRILSHVGILNSPNSEKVILLTDAGINISPNMARKKDIVLNAVDVAKKIGISLPKVAMLAFVEQVRHSSVHSTSDALMLTELNKAGAISGCVIEGPYAVDNAVSPESVSIKGIKGKVAGKADILVAHDINMANAIYKTLQVWVNIVAAGVVVGCRVPIIVTSRADNKATKLYSLALGSYLMQKS